MNKRRVRPGICNKCGKAAMNRMEFICLECIKKEIVKGDE